MRAAPAPLKEPARSRRDRCIHIHIHTCDPCSKDSNSMRCCVPAIARYSRRLQLSRSPPLVSRQSLAAC